MRQRLDKPDPGNPAEAGWKLAYVDDRGGRHDYYAILRLRRRNIRRDERRRESSLREIWRRVTHRSRDVPGSREALADVSDGGVAAERIREAAFLTPVLNDDPLADLNFYNARMSLAVGFIREFEGLRYDGSAYRRMRALLWAIYEGRRDRLKGRAIFGPLGLPKQTYYRQIDAYRSDLALGDWPLYAAAAELKKALFASFEGGEGVGFLKKS